MGDVESRRSTRKVTNLPVSFKLGNTKVTSNTFDLSRNGLFLESDILAGDEAFFPIDLFLPHTSKPVAGYGRVAYRQQEKDFPNHFQSRGMGIELVDCHDRDRASITSHLSTIVTARDPHRIEVSEVLSKQDLRQFIDLPFSLYKNHPYWVPPLKQEIRSVLTKDNPFLQHGEMRLFLAKEGNRTLGRIAAIIDHNFISQYGDPIGFFGFFESVPDFEVSRRLYSAAIRHLKGRGMQGIRGPMSPSINDEICFLLEGNDSCPNLMMPYNHLYYNNFARGFGFQKAKDMLSLLVDLRQDLPDYLLDTLNETEQKGVVFRKFDMNRFDEDIEILRRLNNRSFMDAEHWGFVPITPDEMKAFAEHFKKMADPDIILIAEKDGNPAGYVINLPNFYPALKYFNGRLHPLGILRFVHYRRNIRNVRSVLAGVLKEYSGMKIALSLFVKSILNMKKKGYKSMEYVWVLEDNVASLKIVSHFGGRPYKRYRMYEFPFRSDPCTSSSTK